MKNSSLKTKQMKSVIFVLGFILVFSYQVSAQDKSKPNSSSAPITYGLVIDRSGSLRTNMKELIEAGQIIVAANQPNDETFVISFVSSDKITEEAPVTKNKQRLLSAINNIYIEGGQTALIEALYISAEYAVKHASCESVNNCRRTLILISDGEDKNSSTTEKELFDYLKTNNVRVLIIGFSELVKRNSVSKPNQKGDEFMKKLASQTNGKAFFPKDTNGLKNNIQELLVELRK